ncbi:MAG: hypothetical protein RLZ98_3141, partial [Pseudomonadota bacterium]
PVGASDPKWSTSVVPGQPAAGGDPQVVTTAHAETIKKVNDYFVALERLQGKFTQLDAEKKQSRGKFFVMRPGRFRFDYGYGMKKVVVSDGTYLAIQDLDLNSDDTYELDRTPFRILLRKDVDLTRDSSVLDVLESEDKIMLKLKDKDPDAPGIIQLFMNKQPTLELTGWKIIDAQGLETTVDLAEVSRPEKLDPELFKREQLFKKRL